MKVVYMAHPCGAPTKVQHLANLERAKRWFAWAITKNAAVIADWIIYCEVWDDFDPELRAEGLEHDDAMIKRCDEFWMVGGKVTDGMQRGMKSASLHGVIVRDLTHLGKEPPA